MRLFRRGPKYGNRKVQVGGRCSTRRPRRGVLELSARQRAGEIRDLGHPGPVPAAGQRAAGLLVGGGLHVRRLAERGVPRGRRQERLHADPCRSTA